MRPVIALSLTLLLPGQATCQHFHKSTRSASADRRRGSETPPLSPLTGMDNQPFVLDSFHGHWTLLYFWADSCAPCVQEGIPGLTAFVNDPAHDPGTYRIVAIRFNAPDDSDDWKTFHANTEFFEKTLWHGIPPYPLVFDATSRMSSDWGIQALPTYALIDPRGRLVPDGDLVTLEAELRKDRK